jgi:hypothetical protein
VRKTIGATLVAVSIVLFAIDRVGIGISSFVARLYCADSYMQPVDGVVGDLSCGFNADMYFVVFVFIILIMGIFFLSVKSSSAVSISRGNRMKRNIPDTKHGGA